MPQVYNYLLQSYPVMQKLKYPALKRNELRKVYGRIINISRHSPVYKIDLSKESQEYAIGIKETAIALKTRIKDLSNDESKFNSRKISISNDKVVTTELLNDDINKLPQTITLKVNSLASNQINKGMELYQISHGLGTGSYEFDAKVQNQTYALNYHQAEKTENIETMKNISDYLNNSVSGINAYVESDKHTDYCNIVIESEATGNKGERIFSLADKDSDQTGIVDFFDLNHMEQKSGNADFEINGNARQTATNTFTLENTLKITLHDTSDTPVTISFVPNSSKILPQVKSVIDTYNELINLAATHSQVSKEHYRATKLITEVKNIGKHYKEELESCGFKSDENGRLSIDEVLASQAAEDGGMENLFTRSNGIASSLIDKTDTIILNPMDYLDKKIVTYPGNERTSFANPYVTSIYTGMLFNYYC